VPELHRTWYAVLAGRPWPVRDSLGSALGQARQSARQGDWSAARQTLQEWWGLHPLLARVMWVASMAVSALALLLLVAGAWTLRTRPGVLVSFGLLFLDLVLMPGPIGYARFWMPGVPLAAAVMACAFPRAE
jgi:hypothetical protein